jgi:phosphate transport system protein
MSVLMEREIDKLKKKIMSIGTLVEENVRRSIQTIKNMDKKIVDEVNEIDDKIDQWEVEIEEECLKILALHQPVAIDLRFIIAVLKINNDLERVGDHAVNIVNQSLALHQKHSGSIDFDFTEMVEKVQMMLKNSLDALVNLDTGLAQKVRIADDEVDDLHRQMYVKVEESIKKDKESTGYMMNLMQISRNLERIADLSTNIAEDVIYMIQGDIIRHRPDPTSGDIKMQ